jgi:hypothetical protein
MPTNKDFKRLIRARMEKTGEAYTTARLQLLRTGTTGTTGATGTLRAAASARVETSKSLAALAGMSDASVKKATGCNWERWVAALDYAGAFDWSHKSIANYVRYAYKTPDWWTQMVTVGYERIKGLREKSGPRTGGFETSRSKAIVASPQRVYRAFTDARVRKTWLPGVKPVLRKSTPNRVVRMAWDDGSFVEAWLSAKAGKTMTRIEHRKLTGKEDADRRRGYWAERLSVLAQALGR